VGFVDEVLQILICVIFQRPHHARDIQHSCNLCVDFVKFLLLLFAVLLKFLREVRQASHLEVESAHFPVPHLEGALRGANFALQLQDLLADHYELVLNDPFPLLAPVDDFLVILIQFAIHLV